ncbi:hypothetical protein HC761_00015 [bacterium]|nr:hypothetical protein [bacterium]
MSESLPPVIPEIALRRLWIGPVVHAQTLAPVSIGIDSTGEIRRTEAKIPFARSGEYARRLSFDIKGNDFNFLGFGPQLDQLPNGNPSRLNVDEWFSAAAKEVVAIPRDTVLSDTVLPSVKSAEVYRTSIYGTLDDKNEIREVVGSSGGSTPHWSARISVAEVPN